MDKRIEFSINSKDNSKVYDFKINLIILLVLFL